MESALSRACRSAEELLSRCVQVHALGTTTWVDPSSSWENVQKAVMNMIEKDTGALAYIKKNETCVVIETHSTWTAVCAEGVHDVSNGGQALDLEYIPPVTRCCAGVTQGCPPSKCCPPPTSSCCKPSTTSCCPAPKAASAKQCCKPKDEPKKVCLHDTPGEFSKPKDCRAAKPQACEPGTDFCVKCPAMFPKGSGPTVDVGPKPLNPTLSQYKYSGDALRACQLPLGPLGGGVIAVSGDGGLRQWQIVNEVNHNGHVPDSFWGVKVEMASTTISKVLQSNALYEQGSFVPAAIVTDHFVPPASVDLLKKLPGVPEIEITAKYPTVEVDYPNAGLPVDIHMTAFNPCIPLNTGESSIPVIVFNFEVTNPMGEDVQVSLLNSQQNMVGWDGVHVITNEVVHKSYGGNSNALLQLNDGLVAIDMINSTLVDPNGQHYNIHDGHFANAVSTQDKDIVSTLLQYDSVVEMWSEFTSAKGLSGNGQTGPSPDGRTWNAALAVSRVVPAKSKTTFTFFLAWHFPHRYTNWGQPGYGNIEPPMYLGNKYAAFYPTISDVLKHTHQNLPALLGGTMAFRDAMFDSTLPWQLIDSAAGRVSVVRSPTCMFLGDGRFYAFEGCNTTSGCCPLNCTHVWNYEQCLCQLWPDVELTMRDVDLVAGHQVSPADRMLSRTSLPLAIRPQWMYWKDYDQALSSTTLCVDGEMGGVLKLYREVRFGCPRKFFDSAWPSVKAIMKRWMTHNDQGDGTMKIAQPNTYDCSMYGVNTFIGALYLCGLRAAEEMAKLQGDAELATEYHERYELGRASLDRKCFVNGQWYTQEVDPQHAIDVVSTSTFVDSLLGQWWGYILQLGDILPADHCQSNVVNIFAHNHVDSFVPSEQSPREFYDQRDSGLVIGAWADGKPPPNRLQYTTECAWTGLSGYYASLCIYLGVPDVALHVLEDNRNCYDGTRRSPWNEIECGDHYSRPMCAFQLFATASGLTFDLIGGGPTMTLGFAPRLSAAKFKGFYALPTGWGQYVQDITAAKTSGAAVVKVSYGHLTISELRLPFISSAVKVTLSTSPAVVAVSRVDKFTDAITIIFKSPVTVSANQSLFVTISPSPSSTSW